MSTLIKIIVTAVLSLSLFSCQFNFGIQGNGNVMTKERTIEGHFDQLEVSHGLEVYLTQDGTEQVKVQADENLHDAIVTVIEGTTLKIYTNDNIGTSEAKKIMVTFNTLSRISATSGSAIYTTNSITNDELDLETASGADMKIDVKTKLLKCTATSGSDLTISGNTDRFTAVASSGSDIDALELIALTAEVNASSGADIQMNSTQNASTATQSGGRIYN